MKRKQTNWNWVVETLNPQQAFDDEPDVQDINVHEELHDALEWIEGASLIIARLSLRKDVYCFSEYTKKMELHERQHFYISVKIPEGIPQKYAKEIRKHMQVK